MENAEQEEPDEDENEPGSEKEKKRKQFDPTNLDKTAIALPLLDEFKKELKKIRQRTKKARKENKAPKEFKPKLYDVIIDLNLRFPGGRKPAEKRIQELIEQAIVQIPNRDESAIKTAVTELSPQYVFARLHADIIRKIIVLDMQIAEDDWSKRAIYRIWPDFKVAAFMNRSISTVKADAAHYSFSALGKGIVWAVMDSGIDRDHPHFKEHNNIHEDETYHIDFTQNDPKPFQDDFGHGTHVAGIIAGQLKSTEQQPILAATRKRNQEGDTVLVPEPISAISGMAPGCKLVSMKVLNNKGMGLASSLISAIGKIQEINGYGRDIKIHGVNLSLGYNFEPEWFACGQSPLCVEVDRLVKSGVVVVAAAGNTGYGTTQSMFRGDVTSGLQLSINDPGNADLAITVGSTHRDMPHTYGVSYFSSKGPTGDGRIKPDLVAPGEKIISCAAGKQKKTTQSGEVYGYIEDSGTSMAAPHVSGVIAAFLSIRREFIGKPEVVKELFMSTATDLKRDRYFQGHGLVDLIRAIQSV